MSAESSVVEEAAASPAPAEPSFKKPPRKIGALHVSNDVMQTITHMRIQLKPDFAPPCPLLFPDDEKKTKAYTDTEYEGSGLIVSTVDVPTNPTVDHATSMVVPTLMSSFEFAQYVVALVQQEHFLKNSAGATEYTRLESHFFWPLPPGVKSAAYAFYEACYGDIVGISPMPCEPHLQLLQRSLMLSCAPTTGAFAVHVVADAPEDTALNRIVQDAAKEGGGGLCEEEENELVGEEAAPADSAEPEDTPPETVEEEEPPVEENTAEENTAEESAKALPALPSADFNKTRVYFLSEIGPMQVGSWVTVARTCYYGLERFHDRIYGVKNRDIELARSKVGEASGIAVAMCAREGLLHGWVLRDAATNAWIKIGWFGELSLREKCMDMEAPDLSKLEAFLTQAYTEKNKSMVAEWHEELKKVGICKSVQLKKRVEMDRVAMLVRLKNMLTDPETGRPERVVETIQPDSELETSREELAREMTRVAVEDAIDHVEAKMNAAAAAPVQE